MKPLVACYKAYRGGEWFGASLESVRKHCAGIVVVMSDQPWRGHSPSLLGASFLPENCLAPLTRFRNSHRELPISVLQPGVQQNSEEQYKVGLELIKLLYGTECGVLIVDTDEIWTESDLASLHYAMTTDRSALYFRSRIWTYLRSPLYRVSPQEQALPVVGLANPNVPTGSSRFSNLSRLANPAQIRDVACDMHHIGYVRIDPEEIVSKLGNTSTQDRVRSRTNWKQVVWDNLPRGENLHPAIGFEKCWQRVEEIPLGSLPTEVTQTDTFWGCLAYHRNELPSTLVDDPTWRTATELDKIGLETTVGGELALCVSAALARRDRITQDDALFLTPRLRMSIRETLQLAEHAKGIPINGQALEIGSGMGGSLAVVGSCAPPSTTLFAVDPFTPYTEENLVINHEVEVGTVADFFKTLKHLRLEANLLQTSSEIARRDWDYGHLDLLLIDGNHSYSHALHDLTAWWPLLKSGGLLLLHDLSGRFPGVVRAASEFESATGLRFNLPYQSSLAWLRKPNLIGE